MTTTANNHTTKTETETTVETPFMVSKLTVKRVTLAVGSLGFAACFSGLLYGNQAFALGFLVMLISAFAYTRIDSL